jgi:hypothetical protein
VKPFSSRMTRNFAACAGLILKVKLAGSGTMPVF